MNKKNVIIAVVAVLFLAVGVAFSIGSTPMMTFSSDSIATSGSVGYGAPMMNQFDSAFTSASPEMMQKSSDFSIIDGAQSNAGQFIIKRGDISMQVNDANIATINISDLATSMQGSVLTKSLNKDSNDLLSGYITIQVPSDKFDIAFSATKEFGSEVTSENVSAEDVTEQVIDIEVRLKNAQAEEASYLAVLAKAETVEDILAVQQYLSQVRQTIEQLEAEQKYLSTQTTYSVITVYMTEEVTVTIGGQEFRPWQAVIDAVQIVVNGFQSFIINLIQIIIIGTAILVPTGLLFLIGRAVYRKFKK